MDRERIGWYSLVGSGLIVIGLVFASAQGLTIMSGHVQTSVVFYHVEFSQIPNTQCGGELWGLPWAVTLGNSSIRKGGGDIPANDSRGLGAIPPSEDYLNLTKIIFTVPDGTYHYSVTPAGDFWDPQTYPQGIVSGFVHVTGGDVFVNLTAAVAAC